MIRQAKFLLLFCFASLSLQVFAGQTAGPETKYYVGEATTTRGKEVLSHPYIVARTTDRKGGTISETVVSFQESGFSENSSVMKIEGDHFTMSVSGGLVAGSGVLIGSSWNWTALVGEFKTVTSQNPMRIVDYNLFAGDSTVMGHKDFFLTVGTRPEMLYMREDVVLHSVEKQVYETKREELLKR